VPRGRKPRTRPVGTKIVHPALLMRLSKAGKRSLKKRFYYFPTVDHPEIETGSEVMIQEVISTKVVEIIRVQEPHTVITVMVSDLTFNKE